ncbi:uncharacterized protein GGS25DRAFT_477881 [Hypoxylon fragiforme]|uniref:uncharacterized protein n=1 Tax=Hypoxylon fragiforme TaxID=63214 RepID=UPI0020C5D75F|nr:uncharacterized protein GGS25DRAFT_477881 [Hypoxylon fragiforme]KAI2612945.1 hypothetical protein GGS25DRAFT_477881 [Hypoxylon fragiforme]
MVTTRSASKAASPAPRFAPKSSSPSSSNKRNSSSSRSRLWAHAPSRLTLFWLAVSLPLVAWDSGYVLLRPLTMEGGSLHWPLYTPYKLYGEVDHVYGWKAFKAGNGFTGAQGALNVLETTMYLVYLWLYFARGTTAAGVKTGRGNAKVLSGRPAAIAVLTAFSAAVMTLSKTALYWLQEYFSNYDNIGHNNLQDLILLWIIPNGLWLIFPSYLIYVMGSEIVEGLTAASTGRAAKSE